MCTITIYDSSSTLWQRQDPAFVGVLGLFTKEVDEINFHVAFIVEPFLTKMIRKRTEQIVVRWRQGRRIRWMNNRKCIQASIVFTARLCNMKSRVVMRKVNAILLSLEFFSYPIPLLTAEIGGHGATT